MVSSFVITFYTAAVCLVLFTTVAGIDGLYFHLYRYRLFRRPQSRYEHSLHTINVTLFVPLVALIFCVAPTGIFLWLAAALFFASILVEILDVLCEPGSRSELGGITRSEYLMNFIMAGMRFGAIVPMLANTQPGDWLFSKTDLAARPLWLFLLGAYIIVPGVLVAVLHIVLGRRGDRILAQD